MSAIEKQGVYSPPSVDTPPPVLVQRPAEGFFAVSPTKLAILNVASLGVYSLYWFYKNWKLVAAREGARLMPFWRALFYIFFTHELFRLIASAAEEKNVRLGFDPKGIATGVVVLGIGENIASRMSWQTDTTGLVDLVGALLLIASTVLLCRVQHVVNRIHGDPEGARNAQFSAGNVLVLVVGGLLWVLMLASAAFPEAFSESAAEELDSASLPFNDDA